MSIKKVVAVAVAVLALGAFSAVSAQVSVGGSFNVSSNFGGGTEVKVPPSSNVEIGMPWGGGGLGLWVDVMGFAEINADLVMGVGNIKGEYNGYSVVDESMDYVFFNIGVLGKYPIDLGSVIVFPGVGIDYQICMNARIDSDPITDAPGIKHGDLSRMWLKFGGGVDYPFNDAVFLRASLLYGIGFGSTFEDNITKLLTGAPSNVETSPLLSHGLQLKVGLGFSF